LELLVKILARVIAHPQYKNIVIWLASGFHQGEFQIRNHSINIHINQYRKKIYNSWSLDLYIIESTNLLEKNTNIMYKELKTILHKKLSMSHLICTENAYSMIHKNTTATKMYLSNFNTI